MLSLRFRANIQPAFGWHETFIMSVRTATLRIMPFTMVFEGQIKPRQRAPRDTKQALREQFDAQLRERFADVVQDSSWERKVVDGHHYLPVVTQRLRTYAEVEILMLTPPGLVKRGDTDNRVKTVIDGLTCPANPQQVWETDSTDESTPTVCLLEDDSLVHRIMVDSRQWYGREPGDLETLLVVTVYIRSNGRRTIGASAVID